MAHPDPVLDAFEDTSSDESKENQASAIVEEVIRIYFIYLSIQKPHPASIPIKNYRPFNKLSPDVIGVCGDMK